MIEETLDVRWKAGVPLVRCADCRHRLEGWLLLRTPVRHARFGYGSGRLAPDPCGFQAQEGLEGGKLADFRWETPPMSRKRDLLCTPRTGRMPPGG